MKVSSYFCFLFVTVSYLVVSVFASNNGGWGTDISQLETFNKAVYHFDRECENFDDFLKELGYLKEERRKSIAEHKPDIALAIEDGPKKKNKKAEEKQKKLFLLELGLGQVKEVYINLGHKDTVEQKEQLFTVKNNVLKEEQWYTVHKKKIYVVYERIFRPDDLTIRVTVGDKICERFYKHIGSRSDYKQFLKGLTTNKVPDNVKGKQTVTKT